jgi:hypothetical protein
MEIIIAAKSRNELRLFAEKCVYVGDIEFDPKKVNRIVLERATKARARTKPPKPCTEPFSRCLDCDDRGGCERYREHRGNARLDRH